MITASIKLAENLLLVRYSGHVDPEQTRRGADDLETLLRKFHPGFRLLTDLSLLESMDLDCVPALKRMMDLCDQAGVDLVVRVIPDPHKDIGLSIMSLFHYKKRVRIVTCRSAAEAYSVLEARSPEI